MVFFCVHQVKCEASSGSDLCTLLSTHVAVVRKEGRVLVGVAKGANENNTVAAVMEWVWNSSEREREREGVNMK